MQSFEGRKSGDGKNAVEDRLSQATTIYMKSQDGCAAAALRFQVRFSLEFEVSLTERPPRKRGTSSPQVT